MSIELTVVLSEEHVVVINTALDLLTRVHLGQLEEVIDRFTFGGARRLDGPVSFERLEVARKAMAEVKQQLTGFGPGASWGINSSEVPDIARRAGDIRQVLRNAVSYARVPEGGLTTNFDRPLQWGELPLIEVARVKAPKQWRCYVLHCSDGSFYCGSTNDIARRLKQHAGEVKGGSKYMIAHRPFQLVRTWDAASRSEAQKIEAAFKKLSVEQKRDVIYTNRYSRVPGFME